MNQTEMRRGKVVHTAHHNMSGPYRWQWRPLKWWRQNVKLDALELMTIVLISVSLWLGYVLGSM